MQALKTRSATQAERKEYDLLRDSWRKHTDAGKAWPRALSSRLNELKWIVNPAKIGL